MWDFPLSISSCIYCVCVKRITLCNCLCSSSSCFSASIIPNIREFGAKNYFTDQQTANTIHNFRDSVPVLNMYHCYWDVQKFEQLSYPSDNEAKGQNSALMQNNPLQQFSNNSNCPYLLKLFNRSIILLLGNVLGNICSEISKIWLIFSWFILATWKSWRKLKSWVEMNVIYFVDEDHQWWVIAVDVLLLEQRGNVYDEEIAKN